jgi:NAD(P)-dependent dehydrogenase (short-subunit alcohol dehydrogenase family)
VGALGGPAPPRLEALATAIGPKATWAVAAVTDRGAVERALAETAEKRGGIDAVVSNAGIATYGLLETIDPTSFDRVMDVNFRGTWHVMRASLPYLLPRRGYFLAVASLAAALPGPGLGPYNASKAAVESLCDTLRLEMSHRGVDVGVAYFSWLGTDLVAMAETQRSYMHMRASLPSFLRTVSPVSIAVDAIARGVESRAARVIAPAGLRALIALRWALVASRPSQARKMMPEIDRLWRAELEARGGPSHVPTTDPRE